MLDIGVSFAYNPSINKVSFLMIVSSSFSVFGSIINKGENDDETNENQCDNCICFFILLDHTQL